MDKVINSFFICSLVLVLVCGACGDDEGGGDDSGSDGGTSVSEEELLCSRERPFKVHYTYWEGSFTRYFAEVHASFDADGGERQRKRLYIINEGRLLSDETIYTDYFILDGPQGPMTTYAFTDGVTDGPLAADQDEAEVISAPGQLEWVVTYVGLGMTGGYEYSTGDNSLFSATTMVPLEVRQSGMSVSETDPSCYTFINMGWSCLDPDLCVWKTAIEKHELIAIDFEEFDDEILEPPELTRGTCNSWGADNIWDIEEPEPSGDTVLHCYGEGMSASWGFDYTDFLAAYEEAL